MRRKAATPRSPDEQAVTPRPRSNGPMGPVGRSYVGHTDQRMYGALFDLVSFADGELEPEHADAFRCHLCSCASCRASLVDALQLSTRLAALAIVERGPAAARRVVSRSCG